MVRTTRVGVALAMMVGAALMVSGPGSAEARPEGKWWTPKHGDGRGGRTERIHRRRSAPRAFTRQYRSWGGRRVYRDMIAIRNVQRGPRYRAWRTYCPPEYIYSRRLIRVRPVRFYVAVGSPRFHDDYLYGCNFCDDRFDAFVSYRTHVNTCDHRPRGYRVECSDWDAGPGDGWHEDEWRDCHDDGGYDRDRDRDWHDGDVDDDYDR